MKPVCKAEARWVYWRIENPKNHRDKFFQWEKKQMARAAVRKHVEKLEDRKKRGNMQENDYRTKLIKSDIRYRLWGWWGTIYMAVSEFWHGRGKQKW